MNHIFEYVTLRANTQDDWLQSDNPKAYKKVTQYGPNLYAPGDFSYKFNSHGFRCDEFDQGSELPIAYIGCSCTEGVGLPYESTWAYMLHNRIQEHTKKKIPYWNLALGGTGIDSQVSLLYWLSNKHKIKHVFGLMPPLSRREFRLELNTLQMWSPSYGSGHIDRMFADEEFSNHQANRSMMLMDSIIKMNDATCDLAYWGTVNDDKKILSSYEHVNFIDHLPYGKDIARDNIHFGPTYHKQLASLVWYHTQKYF